MAKSIEDSKLKRASLILIVITLVLIIMYLVTVLFSGILRKLIDSFMLIISPAIIALFISYLIEPAVTFFSNKLKIKREVVAYTTITVLVGLIVVGAFFLFRLLIQQAIHLVSSVDFDYVYSVIDEFLHGIGIDLGKLIKLEDFDFKPYVIPGLTFISTFVLSISNAIITGVLSVVFLVFFLIDREKLIFSWTSIFPKNFRFHLKKIGQESNVVIRAYFRSKFLSMVILFILFLGVFVGLLGPDKIGVAILFAFIIAVLDLIPYVGPFIGIAIPVVYAYLFPPYGFEPWLSPVLMIGLNFFIQFLQNNIIIPKLAGKEMKINTLLILVSMVFFGNLLGVWGIIASIPLCGILIVVFSYLKRWYNDEDATNLGVQNELREEKEEHDKTLEEEHIIKQIVKKVRKKKDVPSSDVVVEDNKKDSE
jgi:predicted PurR-regulated permease PerM